MAIKQLLVTFIGLLIIHQCHSQEPPYTPKHFVSVCDTTEFKAFRPASGNGPVRTFIQTTPELWDVDDNRTTHIKLGGIPALITVEGHYKNHMRTGLFTFYLTDSLNHHKRYKLWEQEYINDKLNGEWKVFNLQGTRVNSKRFRDDSLHGLARTYWIDGQSIMEEQEYFDGQKKRIDRSYYKKGNRLQSELTLINGIPNGKAKRYYEDGTLQEETYFVNGQFHGERKYYHPNGQLWIAEEYKEGKPWQVLGNYDSKGGKRNAGTLKMGSGTVIFYEPDGTLRETLTYKDGIRVQ